MSSQINVRVVLLPSMLKPEDVEGRVVVAFDVLRATTTMTAALAAGVTKIVLHPTLDAARAAKAEGPTNALLVGEKACLKPDDFDLGNSPGQFTEAHAGKVLHMATTNGTKALLSPYSLGKPLAVFAGALVNRLAIGKAIAALRADVTLVCAGTEGEVSYEDLLGCGAVLDSLINLRVLGQVNDGGLMAIATWTWSAAGIVRAKPDEPAYPAAFRLAKGAVNIVNAGLASDVQFAARPDVFDVVGEVVDGTVVIKGARKSD